MNTFLMSAGALTGIKHTHTLIITIFIGYTLYKGYLIITGNIPKLEAIKAKGGKITDMILGILMVATGATLLSQLPEIKAYQWIKFALVIAVIVLGIVGFKRYNKMLVGLCLLLIGYILGISLTKSLTLMPERMDMAVTEGQTIYLQQCSSCHGTDGALMAAGAKDLSISAKSHAEKVDIITHGKGLMNGYSSTLSAAQIEAVADYADKLKK